MTPSDRLDAMLRTELRRADDLQVTSRYDAVLARSAQRTRRRRTAIAGTVAALVLGGVGGGLLVQSGQDRPSPAPQPVEELSGTWTRTVTADDVGAGAWTLDFDDHNVLTIEGPPERPARSVTDGASYQIDGDRVRVNIFVNGACDADQVGSYRWTRDGALLYLEVVADDCEARQHLLVGTWVQGP